MRFLVGVAITLGYLTVLGLAAQASFLQGHKAAANSGVPVFALHVTYPHIDKLPVQEPPLP